MFYKDLCSQCDDCDVVVKVSFMLSLGVRDEDGNMAVESAIDIRKSFWLGCEVDSDNHIGRLVHHTKGVRWEKSPFR